MFSLEISGNLLVGIDTSELLSSGPSPRVALETRNKECDYAWVASDLASMDSVPSVILEVAVFNEDETELEAEGSEGMDLLQVQAAILVKVYHEENPIDDCPKISVGVWTRHHGQKVFTGYKECGGGGQAVSNVVFQHLSYACLAVCFFMEPRQMFHHMSWQQLSSWTCGISVAVSETSTRCNIPLCHAVLHHAGWAVLCCTLLSAFGLLDPACIVQVLQ
ncbi:TPA: hypothetical protein ACH3X1_013565 [Trebouxia sp. C0004]